jgi:hypothetical protein
MASYASLDEAFGGSYGKKGKITDENKVYNSPTRRTESALAEHADAIKSLTRSLPIASNDEDASNNYAPARISGTRSGTNQIEPFSVRDYKTPTIPGTHGFAYSPPEPSSDARGDWDVRLDRLVRKMERNSAAASSGETSTHDLLLYIFTGVFMLFVLDTFVQIGKRSK